MQTIKIAGIGTYLPGQQITNDVISDKFGIDREWIELFIGTKTRHFSMDLNTGETECSLTDMCVEAAEKAIQQTNFDRENIDALVLATATPDNLMPSTVSLIMDRLGLNNKEIYQLQSGCSGALQALNLGCQLIKSGSKSHVLVMGGDVCNKFIDIDEDFSNLKSSEIVNYVLFGDGAGAVLLSNDTSLGNVSVEKIVLSCTGKDMPPGQVIDWRGKNKEDSRRLIFEDYKAIEKQVPRLTKEVICSLLSSLNCTIEDINYLLPPQLSKVMTDSIITSLNFPNTKMINVVENTGNNGNALPFLQLEKLLSSIKKGEKALAVAIESSKWIKTGVAIYA